MLKQNEIHTSIGESLRKQGWWIGKLLPSDLLSDLNTDARNLFSSKLFSKAAIGASHSKLIDPGIRGDHTYWITETNTTQQKFSNEMLNLKGTFESYFPIALNNFEGHYSNYPTGTFYKKHLDNSRNTNSRVFSVVTYFNEEWSEGDGGELALYNANNGELITEIKPHFGITAIFFSADFPHEVKETYQTRYSLTGWFSKR